MLLEYVVYSQTQVEIAPNGEVLERVVIVAMVGDISLCDGSLMAIRLKIKIVAIKVLVTSEFLKVTKLRMNIKTFHFVPRVIL